MMASRLEPLTEIQPDPAIVALPKADLHLHQKGAARLERVVARRRGRPPYDWQSWARQVLDHTPPGLGRLAGVYAPDATLALDGLSDADPDLFIARLADLLREGAADGAVLIEVRFGAGLEQHDFMSLFREAERQVREQYPLLYAEAIGYVHLIDEPARLSAAQCQVEACLRAAREGLAGMDLRVDPYDSEAGPALWATAYRWAQRAANAGLGITVHAGEFSPANLAAALRVPGLRRLGHAVYAGHDPALLERLAHSGATVECSLSCNVILGAVPSYEKHPVRQFMARGIPVTLNTDLPVHACTTIGHEYAIAAALGFSASELLACTRNAVQASFTSAERRATLLAELSRYEDQVLSFTGCTE